MVIDLWDYGNIFSIYAYTITPKRHDECFKYIYGERENFQNLLMY